MEAAGLVLGVIPLAIQALSTYRELLSSMKNAKRDLGYLIRDLNTEQQILQNTCEILLRGIVPDSVLDDMIENPFGPGWTQYDNEVRLRLWRSAEVFRERVGDMKQAAIQLQEKLAIGQSKKIHLVDRRSLLDELKHGAHFTLRKKDYAEIMSRLKSGNAILNTLANQNCNLEPNRRSRSHVKLARLIQKLSQGIYAALQSVIICTCTSSHDLGLEMAPRNAALVPGDKEEEAAKSLDFCIIFGSHVRKQSQRWDKVRVRMAADELALPTPPTTPSTGLLRPRSSLSARWIAFLADQSSQKTVSILNTSTKTTVPQSSPTITNLCSTLHQGKGRANVPDCYGHIFNKTSRFNLFHEDCEPENLSVITLRTILDAHGSGGNHGQLTYGDRLRIALTLSYSVLHLYNTPWLARVVTPDDVFFLREQQTPDTHTYYLDRPLLLKTPPKASAIPCHASPAPLLHEMWRRPMEPTILSLGLLLIQIIVGRRIQNLTLDPDAGGIDAILEKQSTASQMTVSVLESGGMNYAAAVQWCLESVFRGAHLDDEKVGQEFHEAVITKLEADMRCQVSMTTPS